MLTNAHAVTLSARLDGADWDDVYAAAIEVAVKSELSDAVIATMAKAVYVATVLTPGKSMRSFHADSVAAGSRKSRPTLINYRDAWTLAMLTEDGIDPTSERVTGANTIIGNSKAANRARFVEHLNELELAERRITFDYYVENYSDVDKAFGPEPVESDESDGDESDESVESVSATDNGYDGTLQALLTLTGRIQRGEFTVEEAAALAHAAKGIVVAAESVAAESVKAPIAA